MKVSRLLRLSFLILTSIICTQLQAHYFMSGGIGSQRVDVDALAHTANYIEFGGKKQITRWFGIESSIGYGHSKGLDNVVIVRSLQEVRVARYCQQGQR